MRKVVLAILVFISTAIIIPVLFGLSGLWMDSVLPNLFEGINAVLITPGTILLVAGFAVIILSVLQLRLQGKGLPISPLPPTELVSNGAYRLCRHPIYFGASIAFLGASLVLGSFWMTIVCWPMFTLFFSCYALIVEEPVLLARYGDAYIRYSELTPLIYPIPGIKRIDRVLESGIFAITGRHNAA